MALENEKLENDVEVEEQDDLEQEDIDTEEQDTEIDEDEDKQETPAEQPAEQKPEKPQMSKAERRIVEQKKELKLQAERIAQLETKLNEKGLKEKQEQDEAALIAEGYDPAVAKRLAKTNADNARLESSIELMRFERQADRLENTYPTIHDNLPSLIAICKTSGLSLEEVCKAKLTATNSRQNKIAEDFKKAALQKAKAANPSASALKDTQKPNTPAKEQARLNRIKAAFPNMEVTPDILDGTFKVD